MDGNEDEARPSFLTEAFVRDARAAFADTGFVTDEHAFAPYRETMSRDVKAIEAAVNEDGRHVDLASGFVADHPSAGYAYYVYDANFFRDVDEAEAAVRRWLDRRYGREGDVA